MDRVILEFLPIAIIAIGCGIMKLTEEVKPTLREQAHAFVGGILLCFSIFLSLSYFGLDYGVRVGASALITFIGLDKAIEYLNKFRGH
ncbi:MAG: hypothetical protein SPI60_00495 [Campylobacter lanienae]|nr:hypothetical protein [Campylobacter lanienae]